MIKQQKILTIIIPAYNAGKYVRQCLESLENQTLNAHKVIIVDDGSNDNDTSIICKEFEHRLPNDFRYIYQENRGQGAARNVGLDLVDTEYVTFLDSDDWLDLRYVEVLVSKIAQNGSRKMDILFTLPVIYDSLTKCYHDWHDKELFTEIFANRPIVSVAADKRLFDLEPSQCRRVFRMDFLRDIHFRFPENGKWEDVFPHFYALYYANTCMGITDVGFFYRINTPTQTTSESGSTRLDIPSVFNQIFGFISKEKCPKAIAVAGIRMLINFSKWSIYASNLEVRKPLVRKLHKLFRSIPQEYIRCYVKENRGRINRLFIFIIKRRMLCWVLDDYLYYELFMEKVQKLRGKA